MRDAVSPSPHSVHGVVLNEAWGQLPLSLAFSLTYLTLQCHRCSFVALHISKCSVTRTQRITNVLQEHRILPVHFSYFDPLTLNVRATMYRHDKPPVKVTIQPRNVSNANFGAVE
jgi:hypothetical protein